jgi:hypothetical protein
LLLAGQDLQPTDQFIALNVTALQMTRTAAGKAGAAMQDAPVIDHVEFAGLHVNA